MYPSETSLIPVSIALARFVAQYGVSAFDQWYGMWFAGLPFRYAAEPVVPTLLAAVYRMTNVPLFSLSIYFVVIVNVVSIVGWGILVRCLTGKWKPGFLMMLTLIVLPWRLFSSLYLSELSVLFAAALMPYVLIAYWNVVSSERSFLYSLFAVVLTTLLLLSNIGSSAILMIGVAACLAIGWKIYGDIDGSIKRVMIILMISLLVATLWYTPGYLITVINNPSLGGQSILTVFSQLTRIARGALPLIAALLVVYSVNSLRSSLSLFSTVWFGTFLFITVYRFISDYDFWMDWTRWFGELEIGIALVVVQSMVRYYDVFRYTKLMFASLIVFGFITISVYRSIRSPLIISSTNPESIVNAFEVLGTNDGNRVFLSGSDTFWLNSSSDIEQLRGGKELSSINNYWADASYQMREGKDPQLAKLWSDVFGIKTVVVHTSTSENYYHDFRFPEKWEIIAKHEYERGGDIRYTFENHYLAWKVDEGVLRISPPTKGDDKDSLIRYLSFRKSPIEVQKREHSVYVFESDPGLVQVSISYHNGWKAFDSDMNELSIQRDPFGFMIITVNQSSEITLHYTTK